jgi:hypothetical protein
MTSNPTFRTLSPEKRGRAHARRDTAHDADTAKAPAGASFGFVLPDSVLNPPSSDAVTRDCPSANASAAAGDADVAGTSSGGAAPAAPASDGEGSPTRQYGSTAQRYAAYRLRAAQGELVVKFREDF